MEIGKDPTGPFEKGWGEEQLPFKTAFSIWWKSLSKNRLQELQDELVELMVPTGSIENQNIIKENKNVKLDENGNYINEVGFKVINNPKGITKHCVFIHGYGASLGCFARNFQIITKFRNPKSNYNYHIHFLDNLTFGLSSNPKLQNSNISRWRIKPACNLKLINDEPTEKSKLYKKYYKLIEGFQIAPKEFEEYQEYFTPILQDLETFYCDGIDQWRKNSGIDKIDYLVGHSFGAYWSASYSLRFPDSVSNLILLSPVGMERHVLAITSNEQALVPEIQKPNLDPTSYKFLSRYPILSNSQILKWYWKIPFLPRILPFLGHWGTQMYFSLWMKKLLKINKLIEKHGGPEMIFKSNNDLVYGTKKEVELIIEYLYNSISTGTTSDIYIKYLLTPATVSKWPLYDKFVKKLETNPDEFKFNCHIFYGQYDFMNSEAGYKLIKLLNENIDNGKKFTYNEILEGGHNLYIDNPFDTNQVIYEIAMSEEKELVKSDD
ncbi:unnamed protein product [Candida verbasci]|uniref:AB hydrolase-1 domain-containing protein n=1 Tax=Candida verbasci TaxID=1227364 RepID=A0A9W4TY55_9ASCO|nr:unnamed protein product [Candida verbasci]